MPAAAATSPLVGAAASAPVEAMDSRAIVEGLRQATPRRSSSIVSNVLVFIAVLLVFLVFTRMWNEGKPKEANMFGGGPPAGALAEPESAHASAPAVDGAKLSGTVTLADGVTPGQGVLFVVVRNAGGPERGPPLAVRRIESPSFPVEFEVGASDEMIPGQPFTGPFDVTARLDGDGNAMTRNPADLQSPTARGVALSGGRLTLILGGSEAAQAAAAPAPAASAPPSGAATSPAPSAAATSPAPAAAAPAADAGAPVRGKVVLADAVTAGAKGTLYIVLRAAGSPDRGPPVAVKRIDGPQFPVEFTLDQRDVMLSGVPFVGPFDVWARLDADGNAMTRTAGDTEASAPGTGATAGGAPVTVTLDRRR